MKDHINRSLKKFVHGKERSITLLVIYDYLINSAPPALNCDDIIRSSLVLSVSSLDLLVHDLIKEEVLYRFKKNINISYINIPIMITKQDLIEQIAMIEQFIDKQNSYKSFVAPDKIAEALQPIVNDLWRLLSVDMQQPEINIKRRLRNIIDLRNRIAHCADLNPTYSGIELWPISKEDVWSSIEFLADFAFSLSIIVNNSSD